MLVLQILEIPFIAILLLGAIFVIGSTGVSHPDQPLRDDLYHIANDEPDLTQTSAPPSLPRQGCNL
jgi:hypothetical protein